jgi:L-amino acid N-acyltransferase YncA
VIVGRGLAGRLEVSIEVDPARRGRGIGEALAAGARSLAPDGEPIFAQVAPGNVASLRAFLAAGYRPICSEVLFLRRGHLGSRWPDDPASDGSAA